MKIEDYITKVRALKLVYIDSEMRNNQAKLAGWLDEFVAYSSILFDHYGDIKGKYIEREAEIKKDEYAEMKEHNADPQKVKEFGKITIAETDQRVEYRVSKLKAERDRLEQIINGVKNHINTAQSLMKNWNDEAKGIR